MCLVGCDLIFFFTLLKVNFFDTMNRTYKYYMESYCKSAILKLQKEEIHAVQTDWFVDHESVMYQQKCAEP